MAAAETILEKQGDASARASGVPERPAGVSDGPVAKRPRNGRTRDGRSGRPLGGGQSLSVRDASSRVAAAMLVAADPTTAEHSDDVEMLVGELCGRLEVRGEERETVLLAARLHDVGKVAVPQEVLGKPGPLDRKEWKLVKRHTLVGEEILRCVPELEQAATLVRHSHEHFDGSGYPDGLSAEEIPLGSRIILCADAFHAIRSDRPYRRGRSTPEALAEIQSAAGGQFDPGVVDALAEAVAAARRPRRRLPRRLAVLLSTLAIGSGGAYAAERGWVPSPIPGLGPDRSAERTAELTALPAADGDSSAGDTGAGSAGGEGRSAAEPGARGRARADGQIQEARLDRLGRAPAGDGSEATAAGPAPGGEIPGSEAAGDDSGPGAPPAGSSTGGDPPGGDSGGGSGGGSPSGGGRSGSAPGQGGTSPGQSGSAPGQSGSAPGQSGSTPGQSGSAPGQSGSAPGQSGSAPGQSGSAPGHSGGAPGRSGASGNSASVSPQ